MRESFVFGITLWIAIWPMAMIIIYRSFTSWYIHGIVTWLWVSLADLTYAIIAFSLGGILSSYLQDNAVLWRIISACVLLGFGIYMLRKSTYKPNVQIKKEKKASLIKDFTSAYALTIVNPMTILFFRGFSWQIVSSTTTFMSIVILSLWVFIGSLLIQSSIALISGWIKSRIINLEIVQKINIIASSIVIVFALKWLLGR